MRQTRPPRADEMREALKSSRTVAVIGLSDDPSRAAYGVSSFLKARGFRIVPVHPKARTALGEQVYTSLSAIPDPVDLVYMFRVAEAAPAVAEEAIAKGARFLWMPEGVVNEEAAARARDAGLTVIMDRCAIKVWAAVMGPSDRSGRDA
ncbi:MAG: CoA-binding protein [Candidatus Riflebacteria bacterium]|nr:CoA-binding protein [Candidatus Riflebacteria bacterium]